MCLLPLWAVAAEQPVAIALHGGAGTIERDRMSAEVEPNTAAFSIARYPRVIGSSKLVKRASMWLCDYPAHGGFAPVQRR